MVEIERKFLVNTTNLIDINEHTPDIISQAYLFNEESKSVRIRIKNKTAFITIKSSMTGISRFEYEYEIPVKDAREIIKNFELKTIRKKRYELLYEGKLWEVDFFEGKLEGLVLAEIELKTEDETFLLPNWIGKEVTSDYNYLNANLIHRL